MDEKNLELKIGALVLVSIGILVLFVLLLGHFTTKKGFTLYVYFVNPQGLSPGAPVKIAGSKIGRIEEMTYLGNEGPINPKLSSQEGKPIRARVKIKLWIEERIRSSIHKGDSQFYITTQGILGEPYLEIDPGISGPQVENGDSFFGIDPPRLDRVVSNAANSLSTLNRILERNEENIDSMLKDMAILTHNLATIVVENREKLKEILNEASETLAEAKTTLEELRKHYILGAQPKRIMDNLDKLTERLSQKDSIIAKGEKTLDSLNNLLEIFGKNEKESIKSTISRLDKISGELEIASKNIKELTEKIKKGEGTVGSLLNDEEVYDDLKELIRDLKHNPWKFFWRE